MAKNQKKSEPQFLIDFNCKEEPETELEVEEREKRKKNKYRNVYKKGRKWEQKRKN